MALSIKNIHIKVKYQWPARVVQQLYNYKALGRTLRCVKCIRFRHLTLLSTQDCPTLSLVPRPYPAFQCYMLKSGRFSMQHWKAGSGLGTRLPYTYRAVAPRWAEVSRLPTGRTCEPPCKGFPLRCSPTCDRLRPSQGSLWVRESRASRRGGGRCIRHHSVNWRPQDLDHGLLRIVQWNIITFYPLQLCTVSISLCTLPLLYSHTPTDILVYYYAIFIFYFS